MLSFSSGARRMAMMAGLLALLAVLGGRPPVVTAAPPDRQDFVQVFGRDVFVIVGSTLRNPDATTSASEPLFNNAGVALGITWGEWQAASAQSTAQRHGGPRNARTEVRVTFTGLIPGGVYSLFYGTLGPDSENPLCPNVERTLPLIARNPRGLPDASSFIADAGGRAEFRGEAEGDLLTALEVYYSLVYHADGQTYGPLPNRGEHLTQQPNDVPCRSSFGEDAMRQLVIFQKSLGGAGTPAR